MSFSSFMKSPKGYAVRKGVVIVTVLLLALALHDRLSKSKPSVAAERSEDCQTLIFSTMSTVATVEITAEKNSPSAYKNAFDAVTGKIREEEKRFNVFDANSELSRLNSSASKQPFVCSDELYDVLKRAKLFYELSDGAFDVTVTPLMNLWGFYRKRSVLPDEKEVREAIKFVGMDKIVFSDEDKSVFFTVDGMSIDLGAIAKGYAVDRAVESLKDVQGVLHGKINLGGNVKTFDFTGENKTEKGFVRDPVNTEKCCADFLMRPGMAVATSGSYERSRTIEGKFLSHIMDPRTGKPVENMLSVTVLTLNAVDADGASTAVFSGGRPAAEKIIAAVPGTEILIIYRNADGKADKIVFGSSWRNVTLPELPSSK